MKFDTTVKEDGGGWFARFTVGATTFSLKPVETREKAEWWEGQLLNAFAKMGKQFVKEDEEVTTLAFDMLVLLAKVNHAIKNTALNKTNLHEQVNEIVKRALTTTLADGKKI